MHPREAWAWKILQEDIKTRARPASSQVPLSLPNSVAVWDCVVDDVTLQNNETMEPPSILQTSPCNYVQPLETRTSLAPPNIASWEVSPTRHVDSSKYSFKLTQSRQEIVTGR